MTTATQDKRVALVTGANKGIGYEIARGPGVDGATVLLGCRDERAKKLRKNCRLKASMQQGNTKGESQ